MVCGTRATTVTSSTSLTTVTTLTHTTGIRMAPWLHPAEFVQVASQILGGTKKGWKRARDTIKLWRHREHRLPVGAEVSLYLIQVCLDSDSDNTLGNDLARSGALLRFLNLVSQMGERTYGMTKFHESAAALGIPDWMVSLRHEVAHGKMPGGDLLQDGVKFAIVWLAEQYWGPEKEILERFCSGRKLTFIFTVVFWH